MIIYLIQEIAVRELSANLLFASIASSRGHQVVICSSNDLWLYKRLNLLPKGAIMLKNMNIPARSKKMYEMYLQGGFDLYCHEVESSILFSKFENFTNELNIKSGQYFPFKGVFCWGKRDFTGYSAIFPDYQEKFYNTGSPRVDIWNRKFDRLVKPSGEAKAKPYVLFVSNFSWAIGKKHWSEFLVTQKNLDLAKDEAAEQILYEIIRKDTIMVENIVFSARHLARKYPDIDFIIRPHPSDKLEYWQNAVGNYPNIKIIFEDTISKWISNAIFIIQNGCTSAIEANIRNTPIISFVPVETYDYLSVANSCGTLVQTRAQLISLVEKIIDQDKAIEKKHVLDEIIEVDNELASEKMIRRMEDLTILNNKITAVDLFKLRLASFVKNFYDRIRNSPKNLNAYLPKMQKIKKQIDIFAVAQQMDAPRIRKISKSGILIDS